MRNDCVALAALLAIVVAVSGCQKKVPSIAVAPQAPIPLASTARLEPLLPVFPNIHLPPPTEPDPGPSKAETAFAEAQKSYEAGEYGEAAHYFEQYLELEPAGDSRDEALFKLALITASPQSASPNWARVSTLLKRLIDECPESQYLQPARVILSLQSEVAQLTTDTLKRDQRIKQLSTELDKLKKVDAERRKRP